MPTHPGTRRLVTWTFNGLEDADDLMTALYRTLDRPDIIDSCIQKETTG